MKMSIFFYLSITSLCLIVTLSGCVHNPTDTFNPSQSAINMECDQPFSFNKLKTEHQLDLVFEGGGAKGTVFVGALQELQARGISGRRFVGTSAGAITAALLAAGYTADEMLAAVNEKTNDGRARFTTFMDIPVSFEKKDVLSSYTYDFFNKVDMPFITNRTEKKIDEQIFVELMKHERYRTLFSFIERGGVYEGKKFVEWFTEKLDAGCRNLGSATLKEFYDKTGNELTVVASDTMGHQKLVLNHLTAPDCPVVWAVRMSMSIPFIWQEVRWQDSWGKYRGEDISGHTIVDGGVLSNFPLNLVTGKDDEIIAVMGMNSENNAYQIGFLIDESKEVPKAAGTEPATRNTILDDAMELKTVKRVTRLIDTMTDANDLFVMKAYPNRVCRLPAKGYGTTEFDMSEQRVRLLIEAGREETVKCLESITRR